MSESCTLDDLFETSFSIAGQIFLFTVSLSLTFTDNINFTVYMCASANNHYFIVTVEVSYSVVKHKLPHKCCTTQQLLSANSLWATLNEQILNNLTTNYYLITSSTVILDCFYLLYLSGTGLVPSSCPRLPPVWRSCHWCCMLKRKGGTILFMWSISQMLSWTLSWRPIFLMTPLRPFSPESLVLLLSYIQIHTWRSTSLIYHTLYIVDRHHC